MRDKFKLHIKVLILTLLSTIVINSSVVMAGVINFENITIDDGLVQSTVETLYQSRDGYMWIGTNDGLNKYNGYEFKVYKSDNEENNIVSNYILSINEDDKGNLWVGTDNGISKINLIDNITVNYNYYNDDENTPFYNVDEIKITSDGHMLIGCRGGLYYYNEKLDKFERILYKDGDITNQEILTIEEDNDNNLWIGTYAGLNKIDIKNKKIYKYESDEYNAIKEKRINSVVVDKNNYLWIGTHEDGLSKLDIDTNKIETYVSDKEDKFSIPSDTVRELLIDRNGVLWIGSEGGLSKYEEDKFITYNNKSYDENSLANNIVYSLIEDKTGMIWIGTYTGISTFDPTNKIEYYKNDPLNENSLSSNVIHGIYEDDEGLLWVGTRSNGVNIINLETQEFKHINEGNTSYDLSSPSVRVITGQENIVYIGTRNGLNIVDKNTMEITNLTTEHGLINNNIKSILLDSKGYLWIGTPDGANILDTRTNKIISINEELEKNGISDTYIEEIYEDEEGIYWLGNMVLGVLIKIDPENKTIKHYKTDLDEGENSIRCITSGDEDTLWIGTTSGLLKFNKSNETFKHYTVKDGLSNNTVYGILKDSQNNLWMSTNNGLSKFDIKSESFSNLSSTDGLQSNEFNGKASYKCRDGSMVFGGVKGMNIFKPEEISTLSYLPSVTIDNIEVSGVSYKDIDELKFDYNENFVRIKYFIPEYRKNNNVHYYYKLEGQMDEWVLVKNNEVIFNKLDPGDYTFKIKARSQNGNMGEEKEINFTIKQPFWKSHIAQVIYILLIILIIYKQTTKVKRLDKLVTKKSEELNKEIKKSNQLLNQIIEVERTKNNYFVNLSHELRTPLNVLSSLEQIISNFNKSEDGIPKEKLDHYTEMMKKNINRLLNLINNIIDTAKIENGKYQIIKEEEDIVYVTEEATLGMKDAIESKGITLIFDTDIEEKNILCDKYEIERCIVNLVNNAYKFTPSSGTITVNIKDLDNKVMITVEDTGIGIDKKYHETIFDRFNQVIDEDSESKGGSGLGLTITKQIIDLHNGEIYVESEKNVGTKFTIILPEK